MNDAEIFAIIAAMKKRIEVLELTVAVLGEQSAQPPQPPQQPANINLAPITRLLDEQAAQTRNLNRQLGESHATLSARLRDLEIHFTSDFRLTKAKLIKLAKELGLE